jgi:zona occludens toxin
MTISAYTGLPGHGKSYGVVANIILPALRQKRIVYTNIPLNDELCLNDFGMCVIPFHTDDIIKNPNWFRDVFRAGSIIVIDEVWRLWPSGLKLTQAREADKEFLAEHRHMVGENGLSTEVVLVTQDLSQVASFARTLVENTFRVTKLSSLGLNKGYRVDVYFGVVTGAKPNPKNREREIFGKFSKDVYKYYKSHTKSQTGEAGDETRTDGRFNILGRFSIKLGVAFVIVVGIFIYSGVDNIAHLFGHDQKKVVESSPPKNDSASIAPARVNQPRKPAANASAANSNSVSLPKFLSAARRLLVAYTLGTDSTSKDFYVIEFSDYTVTLDAMQLQTLGYKLEKISDCVVRVSGFDYAGFFMCPKKQEPSTGFGSELAEQADSVTSEVM